MQSRCSCTVRTNGGGREEGERRGGGDTSQAKEKREGGGTMEETLSLSTLRGSEPASSFTKKDTRSTMARTFFRHVRSYTTTDHG